MPKRLKNQKSEMNNTSDIQQQIPPDPPDNSRGREGRRLTPDNSRGTANNRLTISSNNQITKNITP